MSDLISRQAAINELDRGAWGVEWDKALAKTMIKSLPSADASSMQDRCKFDASLNLISKQDAIDATWFEPNYTDPLNVLTEVRDKLKALPSAEPEIIRCKNCINYEWMSNRIPEEQTWFCLCWNAITDEDDYCSFAKRRTDE